MSECQYCGDVEASKCGACPLVLCVECQEEHDEAWVSYKEEENLDLDALEKMARRSPFKLAKKTLILLRMYRSLSSCPYHQEPYNKIYEVAGECLQCRQELEDE